MPLVDLSQWHALLLSAALIWAGVPPAVRVKAPREVNEAFAAVLVDASADDKPFAPFLDALEVFGGCHAWSSAFEAAGFTAVSLDTDYVISLDLSTQLVLAVAFALHLRIAGVALLAVPPPHCAQLFIGLSVAARLYVFQLIVAFIFISIHTYT